jgi:hypothetical protein
MSADHKTLDAQIHELALSRMKNRTHYQVQDLCCFAKEVIALVRPADQFPDAGRMMPADQTQLLPCPFCGAQPTDYAIEPHTHNFTIGDFKMPDHEGSHIIECQCGAGFVSDTREAAASLWNARAAFSQPAQPAPAQPMGAVTLPLFSDVALKYRAHHALTPIEQFIYDNEPADPALADVFRENLGRVLDAHAQPQGAGEAVQMGPWYKGYPPFPQDQEWFIAETIFCGRVVLRSLDEGREHKGRYAFTTACGTHVKAEAVTRWMQFPDCAYLPPASQQAQDTHDMEGMLERGARAWAGVDAQQLRADGRPTAGVPASQQAAQAVPPTSPDHVHPTDEGRARVWEVVRNGITTIKPERPAQIGPRMKWFGDTVTTAQGAACKATQRSDQMVCDRCKAAWDVNDAEPPECLPASADAELAQSVELAKGRKIDAKWCRNCEGTCYTDPGEAASPDGPGREPVRCGECKGTGWKGGQR